MSERSLNLLARMGGIDENYIDEAGEDLPAKKKIHWLRWAALAACLTLAVGGLYLLPRLGGNASGSGTNPPEEGPSTFMSYAGPVFPLTLKEENPAVTAERNLTLDFAPWVKEWWSNEDEANSRSDLTEEERQEVLAQYDEWFPDGGYYRSSTDILVTDEYTLTNSSDADQTLTVLYPFAGSLSDLEAVRPALTVDGAALETTFCAGRYAGGYMGAVGGDLVTPVEEGGVNLIEPGNWEDYRDILADGGYLRNALGDYPDFSEVPAAVYEFTDPWGPEEDDEAGIPNPTIRATFRQDIEHSRVLTAGFDGGHYGWDTGEMGREFSIPQPGERGYGEKVCRLIVIGEDIRDLETQGYATGGWDATETVESGVTVRRYETDLETILRQTAERLYADKTEDQDIPCGFEVWYGLLKGWLITDGPLSARPAARYDTGSLEENEVANVGRVFYLEAEVTIPAGGSVTLTAAMRKAGSCDYYGARGEQRGVYGYDLVTRLGSNLNCPSQTATLEDRGQIGIVRQNFGFDLENGVKTVPLTGEEYYLEVRRAPEG